MFGGLGGINRAKKLAKLKKTKVLLQSKEFKRFKVSLDVVVNPDGTVAENLSLKMKREI